MIDISKDNKRKKIAIPSKFELFKKKNPTYSMFIIHA